MLGHCQDDVFAAGPIVSYQPPVAVTIPAYPAVLDPEPLGHVVVDVPLAVIGPH